MPAPAQKLGTIRKLGVIAGGGGVPASLLSACDRDGIEAFILALEGQTDAATVQGRAHIWSRIGEANKMIRALREQGISDLVFIGSIRKPGLLDIRPDIKAFEFLVRAGFSLSQDNSLLTLMRRMLEAEGFRVHGVHRFTPELITAEGLYSATGPSKADWDDIAIGVKASQELGARDIGQAVIVQGGRVVGREDSGGTDALIRNHKTLNIKGGVLVKTCKPQQDRDLDLPVIGPHTVENAARAGLSGIAVQAGASLVIEREKVAQIADRHKIFVIGIDPSRRLTTDG